MNDIVFQQSFSSLTVSEPAAGARSREKHACDVPAIRARTQQDTGTSGCNTATLRSFTIHSKFKFHSKNKNIRRIDCTFTNYFITVKLNILALNIFIKVYSRITIKNNWVFLPIDQFLWINIYNNIHRSIRVPVVPVLPVRCHLAPPYMKVFQKATLNKQQGLPSTLSRSAKDVLSVKQYFINNLSVTASS